MIQIKVKNQNANKEILNKRLKRHASKLFPKCKEKKKKNIFSFFVDEEEMMMIFYTLCIQINPTIHHTPSLTFRRT